VLHCYTNFVCPAFFNGMVQRHIYGKPPVFPLNIGGLEPVAPAIFPVNQCWNSVDWNAMFEVRIFLSLESRRKEGETLSQDRKKRWTKPRSVTNIQGHILTVY